MSLTMKPNPHRAFTIIELLVVVSIIALLIGILLPAITKARDQAKLTMSQTNLRNLSTAHSTYAADWNDRQFTLIDDNMSRYGSSQADAFPAWHVAHGAGPENWDHHPPVILGWGTVTECHISEGNLWAYWMSWEGNWGLPQPIVFSGASNQVGFGSFRIPNARQFNQYVGGRYYDPVFYAPKDTVVWDAVQPAFECPDEFYVGEDDGLTWWSSYCLSPAAMFAPQVMAHPGPKETDGWHDPWQMAAGFRSPSMSQARYPGLKTHMLEHHWIQQRRAECNPCWVGGTYYDCEPYYFNHGWESAPVAMFYDGHVETIGVREAIAADSRMTAQTGSDLWGLWSRDTPLGAVEDPLGGGYFMDCSYDTLSYTSFHVLTTDGIRGRDKLGDG